MTIFYIITFTLGVIGFIWWFFDKISADPSLPPVPPIFTREYDEYWKHLRCDINGKYYFEKDLD